MSILKKCIGDNWHQVGVHVGHLASGESVRGSPGTRWGCIWYTWHQVGVHKGHLAPGRDAHGIPDTRWQCMWDKWHQVRDAWHQGKGFMGHPAPG